MVAVLVLGIPCSMEIAYAEDSPVPMSGDESITDENNDNEDDYDGDTNGNNDNKEIVNQDKDIENTVNEEDENVSLDENADGFSDDKTDETDNQSQIALYSDEPQEDLESSKARVAEITSNGTDSTEDITAPTLNNIFLSKAEVDFMDTISVTVKATDSVSGISNGYILFTNNSGQTLNISLQVIDDETLQGDIAISQYTGSGTYYIESMSLSDKAGNWKYLVGKSYSLYDFVSENYPEEILSDEFQGISFTVDNAITEDVGVPELIDIKLNKTNVKAQDVIVISVEAKDAISGLEEGYIYFVNETTGKKMRVNLIVSSENTLQGELSISQYTGSGNYYIEDISISDKAGNWKHLFGTSYSLYDFILKNYPDEILSENLQTIKFTVNNQELEDNVAPELIDIAFDKSDVETLDTIKVTIEAKDNNSGLSGGYIYLINKDTGKTINTTLYVSDENMLQGDLKLTQYTGSGSYIIESIALSDKADNWQYYYGTSYSLYDFISVNYPNEILPEKYSNLKITVTNTGKVPEVTTPTTSNPVSENDTASNGETLDTDDTSSQTVSSGLYSTISGDVNTSVAFESIADKTDKIISDAAATGTPAVVNVSMNNTDTIPATAITAIAGKDVTLALSIDTNTLVTMEGSQFTAADASDIKLISGKTPDGNATLNVRSQNLDLQKNIVIFNYMGLDKVGSETTLYFVNLDGSLVEFRNSPVYDNGFVAYGTPLVNANYKMQAKQ
jgi:hypothetical protein